MLKPSAIKRSFCGRSRVLQGAEGANGGVTGGVAGIVTGIVTDIVSKGRARIDLRQRAV